MASLCKSLDDSKESCSPVVDREGLLYSLFTHHSFAFLSLSLFFFNFFFSTGLLNVLAS